MLLQVVCWALLSWPVAAQSAADTNRINALNEKSLDLAYSDPEQALALVKQTIQLSRKAQFTKGEIMALLRRGIVFDVTGKPGEAVEAYQEALKLSRKAGYAKGEGSSLSNIGLVYMNQHKLGEARIYFQQAYDIFLAIHNDQMLSSISNNLGMIYDETEREDKAALWFRRALEYSAKAGDEAEMANVYANLGDLHEGMKHTDSAIWYSRKAIEIYERTGRDFYLGKSYNNLALSLETANQYKEAEIYFLKSLEIDRKIGNIPMLASTGYNLSQLYHKFGEKRKEGKLLAEVYPMISAEGMSELAFKVCLAYASWNYHAGFMQQGDQLMQEYIKYHRQYYDQVSAKNLNEVEEKYEVEKKEQENKLLKKANELKSLRIKRNEQNATIANLLWASGLFLLVLLTLLIVLWFRKKSFQRELENQQAVFEATLAERKRISFDLHDNVGSQLSYVVNNLELMNQHSKSQDSPESQRIERTFKMSQGAIDSLRDTVWALHNSAITVEMLGSKLESFARKVVDTQETELVFESEITANHVISAEITMHIFRIFQESVNNVLKHAGATRIEVYFKELENGKLILEVLDNGKGIAQVESPEGHFGLKNMADRAGQIGGIWKIEKAAGGGTKVYLEV